MILAQSKAIRTVLRWQVIATAILMLAVGLLAGVHGAISALLGGLVLAVGTRGGGGAAGGDLAAEPLGQIGGAFGIRNPAFLVFIDEAIMNFPGDIFRKTISRFYHQLVRHVNTRHS
jgi:hypothetical protein